MRHYDRAEFRHLNDGQRYRDYDYRADDGWQGLLDREPARKRAWREPPHKQPERHWFVQAIRHPKLVLRGLLDGFLRAIGP